MLLSSYVLPILGLCVGIATFLLIAYAFIKVRLFISILIKGAQEIFTPRGENQLSPFAEIFHFHAMDIGSEVSQGFQRSITGSMGGSLKRANAEITAEMAKENPQLAQQMAFNSMLPKSMTKNPLINMFMQSLFNKAISVGGGHAEDSGNHHHSNTNPDAGYMG